MGNSALDLNSHAERLSLDRAFICRLTLIRNMCTIMQNLVQGQKWSNRTKTGFQNWSLSLSLSLSPFLSLSFSLSPSPPLLFPPILGAEVFVIMFFSAGNRNSSSELWISLQAYVHQSHLHECGHRLTIWLSRFLHTVCASLPRLLPVLLLHLADLDAQDVRWMEMNVLHEHVDAL